MSNNQGQWPQVGVPAGLPQMSRNARRMYEYNTRKYKDQPIPSSWADDVEPQPRVGTPRIQSPRAQRRSQNWKTRKGGKIGEKKSVPSSEISDPAEYTPKVFKAKSEKLMDEPLWQEGPVQGTHPVIRIYAQNMDMSTFPLLLERVYLDLEAENPRIRREMPFCMFQHACTSVLNIAMIDHLKTINAEDRYSDEESPMNFIPDDFHLPAPIAEYIKNIANTTTPQGDLVRTNIPEVAVPNARIQATDDIPAQDAGGFGVCGAANHNAYECYVSPLVTSRLVEATAYQNATHDYGPWNPLPDSMTPANAQPTSNLLGYRPSVERLTPEGLQKIQEIEFPNGDDMQSRVRWSSELMARVSATLKLMDTKYKMHVGKPVHGHNTAALGWIVVEDSGGGATSWNSARLANIAGRIDSSAAMGSSQTYAAFTFGLRRQRTDHARGFCYVTSAGAAIPGWLATINNNFEMVAPFSPTIGSDMPLLRDALHTSETPSGDRATIVTSWLRRNFVIKRDVRK